MNQYSKEKGLKELCEALVSFQDAGECVQFLEDLCTPAELQAMIGRWQVALMLQEKHPYRKISELTGVSTATITRVARFIESGYGGYRKALESWKKHHPHQPQSNHQE